MATRTTTRGKAPVKKVAKKATAKKVAKKASPKKKVAKKAAAKKASKKTTAKAAEKKPRVYAISFAAVYPLYQQKVEKKGRSKKELDEVIAWLTGYAGASLKAALDDKRDLETFFAKAPRMNPNANRIQGVVCGVRVEEIPDPLMRNIRYLDKLVDELARGKKLESILRS